MLDMPRLIYDALLREGVSTVKQEKFEAVYTDELNSIINRHMIFFAIKFSNINYHNLIFYCLEVKRENVLSVNFCNLYHYIFLILNEDLRVNK